MFRITDNKGFQITFDNGYTVSVQFGPGNYSSNRVETYTTSMNKPQSAELAETALLDPDGNFVKYKGDDVQGYRTAEQVLALLQYASKRMAWPEM
jgi:Flp pilus assembly protein TadG